MEEKQIDFSNLPIDNQWHSTDENKKIDRQKKPLEQLLNEHSKIDRSCLKSRLIKEGKLENICACCKIQPIWNEKPLTLQLDHINGINDDNRLENLRLLCPNCHSQTVTYAGRNKKFQRDGKNINLKMKCCIKCGKINISGDQYCIDCAKINAPQYNRHVDRPSLDQLLGDLMDTNYIKTAEKYKVSDKTIRKWLLAYKHTPPTRQELEVLRQCKDKLKNIKIQLKQK